MDHDHYPNAVRAEEIVEVIAGRRVTGEVITYGYECLFLSEGSTRPSMEFSLLAAELNAPNWRVLVSNLVQRAVGDAKDGEVVFFDPD